MDTLTDSKNVFLFGAGKPYSALGYALENIGSLGVRLDVVSQNVPGLIGMDILDCKQTGKQNCKINIYDRQLIIDRLQMQLTETSKSHLGLSTKYLTLKYKHISPKTAKTVRTQSHFHCSGPTTQRQSSRRRSRQTPARTTRQRPRFSNNDISTQDTIKR